MPGFLICKFVGCLVFGLITLPQLPVAVEAETIGPFARVRGVPFGLVLMDPIGSSVIVQTDWFSPLKRSSYPELRMQTVWFGTMV